MTRYRSYRFIDGRPRWVIVDENGDILNNEPNKEELKGLKVFEIECCKGKKYTDRELLNRLRRFEKENGRVPVQNDFNGNHKYPGFKTYERQFGSWNKALKLAGLRANRNTSTFDDELLNYNDTNTCEFIDTGGKRCTEKLYPNNARRFNIDRKLVCFCERHGNMYRQKLPNSQSNAMKSVANRRTGNQDPNHSNTKGDKSQELACLEFGWKDLNKENNNYCFPVDCLDPKTGLFHQVKGRWYNHIEMRWSFGNLEREWIKRYDDMICYCISEDGKRIERIYRFPSEVIIGRTCISIFKSPTNCVGIPIVPWYEQYRVTDEEELKKANKIWQDDIIKMII